jgi:hypothetical protein
MTEPTDETVGHEELGMLAEKLLDTKVAPAQGIAAVALSMALKFHDINTVQDGLLYQQYKLEGRNMQNLHLDMVFETAIRMEMHLMGASERIAAILVEALAVSVEDKPEEGEPDAE